MPRGTQGFDSSACRRAVLFPGSAVLADRYDRGGLSVDDRRVATARVIGAIGGHSANIFTFGDLVEQLGQHRAVAVAAGGEFHRPDVRSGGVHGQDGPCAIGAGPERHACVPAIRHHQET